MSPLTTNCTTTCEASCLLNQNSTTNTTTTKGEGSLFRKDWYSLASGTTLYTIWAGYTALWVVCSVAFWYSSRIQPIKSRSPILVLISGFGGWLLVTNYAMAHYVTGIEQWPCPFSNWALWLALPLFLVPLPLRSLQLYFIFKHNVDKVKAHKKTDEEVTRRVTVVEKRFTESRARNAENGGSNPDDPIEIAKMRSQRNKEQKEKDKKKSAVAFNEMDENSGSDIMRTESAEAINASGKKSKRYDAAFSMAFLMRQPSKLGPISVENLDTVREQLGMDARPKLFHLFPPIVFAVTLTVCFIIGISRQFLSDLHLGPECVGCMVSLPQGVIKTVVIVVMLAIQFSAVGFVRVSEVVDQYRIALELQVISLVWAFLLIPTCALLLTASDCETLRLSEPVCSRFDSFTQECYFKVAASNWVEVVCILITFLVTIFAPVLVMHLNGRRKLKNEPLKFLWPNTKVLKYLSECLKDTEACEAFQKFCISAFCVQNVLFWKDIEQFRRIMDANELRIRAVAIYRQYMTASGNLFLELPSDMQEDMDNKLETTAMSSDAEFDYTFEADPRMFDAVQAEIFRQMETDVFPRFIRSEDAKKLVGKFKDRLVQNVGLVEAKLL
jgi:hypothetical protein